MQRASLILGLLCSVVLIMAACGAGGSQQSATETKPTTAAEAPKTASTIPGQAESLSTGNKYVTTKFEPAFSFRVVDKGWEVTVPELMDVVSILQLKPFLALGFSNPQQVFDPRRPTEPVRMPEPKDWVAWFQNYPHLKTGKPTPVTIGGVSGVEFDLELSSAPSNYLDFCRPMPCVPLWPASDGNTYFQFLGDKSRVTILKVAGETVIIDVTAQKDKFEKLLPKGEKVLDTVEWENPS